MLTIVVTDSRGRFLDTMVDDESILVSHHSGATLYDVATHAINIVRRFQPDLILLIAGINDMTVLNRRNRQVRLISNSRAAIINYLIHRINLAKSMILSACPYVKVAVGGILGIDLNTYNRRHGTSPYQHIVDDSITAINAYIRQMNHDAGLPHPRLTTKVHTWRRGRRRNAYSRLRDGLHPNNLILESWARQIRNFHWNCSQKL